MKLSDEFVAPCRCVAPASMTIRVAVCEGCGRKLRHKHVYFESERQRIGLIYQFRVAAYFVKYSQMFPPCPRQQPRTIDADQCTRSIVFFQALLSMYK